MGAFASTRTFSIRIPDLTPVANDVMNHFKDQGYEVNGERTTSNGWHISLHKGGIFKSVLGLKTALNLELEPHGNSTTAHADVGIFGLQAIPSIIMLFFAWPVALTQIWGLVKQAKLDDEALDKIGDSLMALAGGNLGPVAVASHESRFCPQCGVRLLILSKFCPECGGKLD